MLLVIIIHVMIVIVVIGHLSFAEVAKDSDRALLEAALANLNSMGILYVKFLGELYFNPN